MTYRTFAPPSSLAHLVRCFYALDDFHTPSAEEHRLYPECTVGLSFLHGTSWLGPHDSFGDDDLTRVQRIFVERFRCAPLRLVSRGVTRMVGVELFVWGAVRLLGRAGHALDDAYAMSLVGDELAQRIERCLAENELDEAIDALERWLLGRANAVDLAPSPAIVAATRLRERSGQGSILALADEVNLSVRQLERQFRDQIGVPPKTLARVIRFEEAHHRIWHAPEQSLTELAHALGYADQAHFSREFRALAAKTPSTFSAEASLSRKPKADVAFLQARAVRGALASGR